MRPLHAASVMRGKSRQTDLERPRFIRIARFCHAARPLSVTGKPRSKGSEPRRARLRRYPPRRNNRNIASARIVTCLVLSGLIELAIERRAADFQTARDFGHLTAIVRDRETDDLVLHLLQRPHFAGAGQHRQIPGGRERRYRYLAT